VCEMKTPAVREIEIEQGIHEDGGGFKIYLRMDGLKPNELVDVLFKIYARLSKNDNQTEKNRIDVT